MSDRNRVHNYGEYRNYPNTHDTRNSRHTSKSPHHRAHATAAVSITLPNHEKEDSLRYLDEYSCKPPPLLMIALSLSQIGVFIYESVLLSDLGQTVGPNGPVYIQGVLLFNPNKKHEVWRFLTYMFVHSGYFHITFNVLIQLMLGVPLEMVHRWWRILLIYLSGVLLGSLVVSITDPLVYLVGGSGGVYALIAAHLANVISNWAEMDFAPLRLFTFLVVAATDIGVAIYYRYYEGAETKVSYVGHIGGATAGLLLGVVVLRNLREESWEKYLWWSCLLLLAFLFTVGIIWNIVLIAQQS